MSLSEETCQLAWGLQKAELQVRGHGRGYSSAVTNNKNLLCACVCICVGACVRDAEGLVAGQQLLS